MTIQWRAIDASDMRGYSGSGTFALYAVQNNEVVAIVPLFDWRDFNTDGEVDLKEWALSHAPMFSHLEKGMIAGILLRIRENEPNPNAGHGAGVRGVAKLQEMGFEMAKEGIKATYVKPLVAVAGGTWGIQSKAGPIKQFIVKKGMEKAVLAAVELAAPR